VKDTDDGKIILSVHIDDMLLTAPNKRWRAWFEEKLEKFFTLKKQYNDLSYLGLSINRNRRDGSISLNQHGYLDNILTKYGCKGVVKPPSTPATAKLTESDAKSPAFDKTKYLSLTMSLMYLARFTRPDIQMPVAYLASKCSKPTEEDWSKVMRILRYLAGTRSEGITFSAKIPFKPMISADASHHLHAEGHGQQGFFISNGSAPVAHRSSKIKMITRSSSESELCALEEASTYAVWYRLLLTELGRSMMGPLTILQDNQSTIIMAVQGASFKRTKHLIGRRSFVRERLQAGEIELKYLKTSDMTADILTKPVSKQILEKLKTKLHIGRVG
jgi:hypothetical protein